MVRTIRRIGTKTGIIAIAFLIMILAACGKSEFGVTENTEKRMTITAENAEKDVFLMVGSLEVEEGEKVIISSGLSKGEVKVEIIPASVELGSGEATMTGNIGTGDGVSGTVPAGAYMLKATVLEKATGTISIEVKPA